MSWTHSGDETPKARKPHRCFLCERPIPVGEKHVKRSGFDQDGPASFRMHAACEARARGWDQWEWECHDAAEFRECELGDVAADPEVG